MPQIQITMVESPPQETVVSNEKLARAKPPPICIPHSNFLNFDEKNQAKNEAKNESNFEANDAAKSLTSSQNVPKDAMSRPETSSRTPIELGEIRSKAPNAEQEQQVQVKVSCKKFKVV